MARLSRRTGAGNGTATASAPRDWYRLIFIRSVLIPEDRELLVLPHPLDPPYAQVNQGLRLRFDPSGDRKH